MRRHAKILILVLLALASGIATSALSEPPRDAQPENLRDQVTGFLQYLGIDASAADVDELTALLRRLEQPDRPAEELQADLEKLYSRIWQWRGFDPEAGRTYVQQTVQFATMAVQAGGRPRLRLPEPAETFHGLAVVSRGNGPVAVLAIGDVGIDAGELYRSFLESNGASYTVYAVSLPGFGGSGQLPWPEVYGPSRRPWLNATENALARLVEEKDLRDFVVLGTAAGGYFAARLALRYPERIRAAVLTSTQVRMGMRSRQDPDRPASPEERLVRADQGWPLTLLPIPPVPPPEELDALLASNQHPIYRNYMGFGVRDDERSRRWTKELLLAGKFFPAMQYNYELRSTDLTEELRHLEVPTLVLVAVQDDGSIGQGGSGINQWREMRLLAPELPLTVATFQDTRAYVSEDRPRTFERALADFLAGRPVEGLDERRPGVRKSPHACLSQVVGTTEMKICYGRPAVREREIWGALVPWGRIWRTGADEATTVEFSTDVALAGHCVEAGRYSLFTVPGEDEWTVVLNRVADQWGHFQYDPRFDVLRFAATPEEAPHQERLTFAVDEIGDASALVAIQWAKLAVPFAIETRGGEGPPAACAGS